MGIKNHFKNLVRKIHHARHRDKDRPQQPIQTPNVPCSSKLEQLPVELLIEIDKYLNEEDDLAFRATSMTLRSVPWKIPNSPPSTKAIRQMAKLLLWDEACSLIADMPPGSPLQFCARCKHFHPKDLFDKYQLRKDDWNRTCRSSQRVHRVCKHMALNYHELRMLRLSDSRITCTKCTTSTNTCIGALGIREMLGLMLRRNSKWSPFAIEERCTASSYHGMMTLCLEREGNMPYDWLFLWEFKSIPGARFAWPANKLPRHISDLHAPISKAQYRERFLAKGQEMDPEFVRFLRRTKFATSSPVPKWKKSEEEKIDQLSTTLEKDLAITVARQLQEDNDLSLPDWYKGQSPHRFPLWIAPS